ncbi:MAG: hypothetical protein Q8Q42_01420 [Nanoarchaeota archaeon]|nr:hypothetical protein [Nanoarchaeota archaeon]
MVINSLLGTDSTKGKIVEILSESWPLSAKKIYNRLKKDYSLSITYQATHKAIKEMINSSILEKFKDGYCINKTWLTQIGSLSQRLSSDMKKTSKEKEIKTIQKLTFSDHREFIEFHRRFIEDVIKKEKRLDMVFHYRHVPFPHVMSNEEIGIIKDLMPRLKWTILARKDTPIGRWFAMQWKKLGVNVKLGVDVLSDRLMILNDYICYVYTSKEAIKMWDKSYSIKDIKKFDTTEITKAILNKKYKTVMTIIKDKEIATMMKSFNQ